MRFFEKLVVAYFFLGHPVDNGVTGQSNTPYQTINTHGRRSVGGRGKWSHTFWGRGDTLCCVPWFFSGRNFHVLWKSFLFSATRPHHASVFIAAIFTKFSQLIRRKICILVSTRCQIVKLKCTKFNLWLGSVLLDSLAGFEGPTLNGTKWWRKCRKRERSDSIGPRPLHALLP